MNKKHPFTASHFVFAGFRLIRQPGLRRYTAIPLAINILLFSALLWLSVYFYSEFVTWIDNIIPTWLHWLNVLLWVFFALGFLVLLVYAFVAVANIILSPFNSLLSAKVEAYLTGQSLENNEGWLELLMELPRSMKRETQKFLYYLPRALLLLILIFIPGVNLVGTVLWYGFSGWMMAVQYIDLPMENHQIPFPQARQQLKKQRFLVLGFGGQILLFSMIPLVNLVVIPAAVAGATQLWVETIKD